MKLDFNIKEKIVDKLFYIQKKNWVITVLIFLIVLIIAVIVWQDCVLNPHPSETTLSNILKIEEEYKTKMQNIKKNNQSLKDQIERFKNPKENKKGRNFFEFLEQADLLSPDNTSSENFSPQVIF